MFNAPYGHAFMHALEPQQLSWSYMTIPSGRLDSALVGQALMHGASSH